MNFNDTVFHQNADWQESINLDNLNFDWAHINLSLNDQIGDLRGRFFEEEHVGHFSEYFAACYSVLDENNHLLDLAGAVLHYGDEQTAVSVHKDYDNLDGSQKDMKAGIVAGWPALDLLKEFVRSTPSGNEKVVYEKQIFCVVEAVLLRMQLLNRLPNATLRSLYLHDYSSNPYCPLSCLPVMEQYQQRTIANLFNLNELEFRTDSVVMLQKKFDKIVQAYALLNGTLHTLTFDYIYQLVLLMKKVYAMHIDTGEGQPIHTVIEDVEDEILVLMMKLRGERDEEDDERIVLIGDPAEKVTHIHNLASQIHGHINFDA